MKRIMLATDFSERSDRALRRATLLAREAGAEVDLVHVVDDDRPRRIVDHEVADAHLLLAELVRTLDTVDGVQSKAHVVLADPFVGIARAVEEVGPDLLVIGSHRRQILRDAFVGTTAERVVRTVDCPALMVNGPPVGPYRQVLLTTDLSDNSRSALQRFEQLGLFSGGQLTALNVFDAPALRLAMSDTLAKEDREEYLSDMRAEAKRELAEFVSSISGRRLEQVVRHEETTIANEILQAASEIRVDLIVVSTVGKSSVARMLLGSVAEQILRLSTTDVLVMPPTRTVRQ